jgi:phosphate transport system permease protein
MVFQVIKMATISIPEREQTVKADLSDRLRKRPKIKETLIEAFLFIAAAFSILITVGIVYELLKESLLFFSEVPLNEYLFGLEWKPMIGHFGVIPLVTATLVTSTIAMLIAVPLGLFVAIYLSEYATPRTKGFFKPILEVLAGIPTVVYGFFALTYITPVLRGVLGRNTVEIYNTAAAGIAMGILILPLIATMSEDALNAVPRSLREAAYGLGSTKLETATRIVLPAAFSGIAAALIIGISRAVGETMIVALAAGAGANLTINPFVHAETMTGYIVRISGGDLSYDSIDYNSIFAIGLLLFFITLVLNIISQWVIKHFREEYE